MEKHEILSAIGTLTNLLNSWVVTENEDFKNEVATKIRELIAMI
jgi:hypothetical protein